MSQTFFPARTSSKPTPQISQTVKNSKRDQKSFTIKRRNNFILVFVHHERLIIRTVITWLHRTGVTVHKTFFCSVVLRHIVMHISTISMQNYKPNQPTFSNNMIWLNLHCMPPSIKTYLHCHVHPTLSLEISPTLCNTFLKPNVRTVFVCEILSSTKRKNIFPKHQKQYD